MGWVTTPVLAAGVAFMALFFLQNTFGVTVARDLSYVLDAPVRARLERTGVDTGGLRALADSVWVTERELDTALRGHTDLDAAARRRVVAAAERDWFTIGKRELEQELASGLYNPEQAAALESLAGREFRHGWGLLAALADASPAWDPDQMVGAGERLALERRRRAVVHAFRSAEPPVRPPRQPGA